MALGSLGYVFYHSFDLILIITHAAISQTVVHSVKMGKISNH